MALQAEILTQIDAALERHRQLRSRSKWDDCSDLPDTEVTSITTLMCDTINRLAPPGSQHLESMKTMVKQYGIHHKYIVPHIAGILRALRDAYNAGYLSTVAELI